MGSVAVAELEADYLVVGAGAVGMAFTDALVEHADVSVVMVDRRFGVGGHWNAVDWPFRQPRHLGRDITWQDWLALPRAS
jgi:cation diffusion facilitator CzcD-associated flavoprotein CzcO